MAANCEGKGRAILMLEFYEHANIIIVSVSHTVVRRITELLSKKGFASPIHVDGIQKAKRLLIDTDVNLVIIDTQLPDEDGTQFAIDLARSKSFDFSIIILTKADLYEQDLYQTERMGIVTFKKPLDPHLLLQTIHLFLSFQLQIKKLKTKADKLEQKLEDDRLVNRAKFLLIEYLKMSEQDAHHFIEKKAMDRCVKKTKIAHDIIHIYETK